MKANTRVFSYNNDTTYVVSNKNCIEALCTIATTIVELFSRVGEGWWVIFLFFAWSFLRLIYIATSE